MTLIEFLSQECEFEVRSYSGRAMYGDSTVAIELDGNEGVGTLLNGILRARHALEDNSELEDRLIEFTSGMRSDSMGLGSVHYNPYFRLTDEEKAELDEMEERE